VRHLWLPLLAWASLARGDMPWSDSQIHGPPYAEILATMEGWVARHPGLLTQIEYGKSVLGRPLRILVAYRRDVPAAERPSLFMSGSTHGSEYLNLEDRLPERLLSRAREDSAIARFLATGGALVFVPIVNPDGYEIHSRTNANGVDLNRDWDLPSTGYTGFREVETRLLAHQLLELEKPPHSLRYRVTVDYHCCVGAVLHPWSHGTSRLPPEARARHEAVGKLAHEIFGVAHGTTAEILGYSPLGTSKDYYYLRHGALAFTYEGRPKIEKQALDKHLAWWEGIADLVLPAAHHPLLALEPVRKPGFPLLAD